MTRLRLASLLVTLPLVACTSSPPSVVTLGASDDPRFQNVLAYLEQQLEDHDIPGASIAIIENGTLFAAAGVGSKHDGRGDGDSDQVNPGTLFRVASLTKLVTAATAMSLVEDNTLALDQPITHYVDLQLADGFQPADVLVRQLLDHTAGIPDLSASTVCAVGPGELANSYESDRQPLWALPGAVWNYSNRGYGMAGWAIEAAAGVPYESLVATRVFGPAGMTTATFDPGAARTRDHATGYVRDSAGNTTTFEPDAYDCAATRPAAGVIASALDYASLAQTLLAGGGSMLSPSSVAALETGHADTYHTFGGHEQYGYGLYSVDNYKGTRLLRHEGDDPGYQSALWIAPDRQFAVVVLYNASGRAPSHVAAHAFDQFLDTTEIAAPVETSAPDSWGQFAGSYDSTAGSGAAEVTFDGSNLAVSWQGVTYTPLAQVGGSEFSVVVDGATHDLTFVPDATSSAGYLVSRQAVAVREQPAPTSSK